MKKTSALFGVAVLSFVLSKPAYALINLGFETGDLTGWTAPLGNAGVVTAHTGNTSSYGPVAGTYFAHIEAGGAGTYYSLAQGFEAAAGDTIEGWAAFDYRDYHPFNDAAKVEILDAAGAVIAAPWSVNGADVPDYDDGPWTKWSWTAPSSGTYTLFYGVKNEPDNVLSSFALFDAGPAGNVIPEPATLALLGGGLAGLFGYSMLQHRKML